MNSNGGHFLGFVGLSTRAGTPVGVHRTCRQANEIDLAAHDMSTGPCPCPCPCPCPWCLLACTRNVGAVGAALNDYACGGPHVMKMYLNHSAVKEALHVPQASWSSSWGGVGVHIVWGSCS